MQKTREQWKIYYSLPRNRVYRNLRQRLRRVTLDRGYRHHGSFFIQFECSRDELVNHIENQFKEGMNWSNYTILWELDHIKPLCSFDLSDPNQAKLGNHYTNIRPLFKKENREKFLTSDKEHWIKNCYNPKAKCLKVSE